MPITNHSDPIPSPPGIPVFGNLFWFDRRWPVQALTELAGGPEAALRAYARRYITFTGKNQKLLGGSLRTPAPEWSGSAGLV